MTDTDLHQSETAALAAQAVIAEARSEQRRRQRGIAIGLLVAVLLVGVAVSVAVAFSVGRARSTTKVAPRVGGPVATVDNSAYITTTAGIIEIDLATQKIVRWIRPYGSRFALDPIAIAPGGHTTYVVSDNVLTPIDLATGRAKGSIIFGPATGALADGSGLPSSIALAPNGRTAYIAIPAYGTIVPVRLAPLSAGRPIYVGGHPFEIAVAPNGETAYVPNSSSGTIDVVNLATDAVESPINGIADPHEIAISPNGQRAYVSAGGISEVSSVVPIDLATRRLLAPIALDPPAFGSLVGPVVVSPDGRGVYVAYDGSGNEGFQITMLSTASNRITARFGGFSGPVGLALAHGTLYVLNVASSGDGGVTLGGSRTDIDHNALVPIDLANGRIGTQIHIPASPRALGIAS